MSDVHRLHPVMSAAQGFRLSPQQERLCLLGAEQGDSPYRCAALLRLRDAPGAAGLSRAWQRLLGEHEILRTVYREPAGMHLPLQYVLADGAGLEERRLAGEAEAEAAWEDFRRRPFDLAAGPVARAALFHLESGERRLALCHPALAGDRASLVNLTRALLEGEAQTAGTGEGPLQYADLAEWLAQLPDDEDAAPAHAFWRQVADRDEPPLVLPGERRSAAGAPFRPRRHHFELPSELLGGGGRTPDGAAAQAGAWWLACWQALLARLTGKRRLTLAVAFSGRDIEQLAGAIGLFERYLPVPVELAPGESFAALVAGNTVRLAEAERWQHYARDVHSAGAYRPASGAAWFPCAFELLEAGATAGWGGGAELLAAEACGERFHLRLSCAPAAGRLAITYDPEVLTADAVDRLGRMLLRLATAAAERPEAAVAVLDLLAAEERRRLVEISRGPALEPTAEATVVERIAAAAAARPEHPAVRYANRTLTYGELWTRSGELARHLHAQGVGAETTVGLCLARSPEMIVGLLGVLRAGGAYLPLDPALPAERMRWILEDAQPRLVLTRSGLRSRIPRADGVICLDAAAQRAEAPGTPPSPGAGQAAYALYTSGSTGRPKGVLVTHRNLLASTRARAAVYREAVGRYLLLSPFVFDSSVAGIFWTLCEGGTLVLPAEGLEREPDALRELIGSERVTHLLALPGLYQALLEVAAGGELGTLEVAIVAGERCPPAVLTTHAARLGAVPLVNEYGPTEATVWCTAYRWQGGEVPDPVPIGHPIPGAAVTVLDARGAPSPVAVPGEIHVGGEGLARGYLGRPALTAARFIPDPAAGEPGARLYRTGDRGRRRTDGVLEFLGRLDDQVKLRGHRIELGEIETVLGEHPEVRAAAALLRQDRPGEPRLVAYVVPRRGALDLDALDKHLRSHLPAWMLPSALVPLVSLPVGAHGKLDRAALPAPDPHAEGRPPHRPPASGAETMLAEIWSQVLRVERVGVDDHFLRLGGDSLLGLQVVSRARERGLRVTSRLLFQHPTLGELAAEAERLGPARPPATVEAGALRPAAAAGIPLTPVQQWLLARDLARPAHYNQALVLEVTEPLDPRLLERAVAAAVERHDALRLRFDRGAAGWRQRSAPPDIDGVVSWHDPEDGGTAARRERMDQLQASLDLEAGPLLRVGYFRGGTGRRDRLFWATHHLAVDVVSWRVLLEDFAAAYRSLELGERPELAPPAASFATWAGRLGEVASSEPVRARRAFWEAFLGRPHAPLPTDRPGGANREADAEVVVVHLPEAVTERLLNALPSRLGASVGDLLLAALGVTLGRWCGGDGVRLDAERHGRDDPFTGLDTSRTVGWFTSVYPVRFEPPPRDDDRAAVAAALEQLARIPDDGFTYGLLRYPPSANGSLADPTPSEVLFNHLGRIDAGLTGWPRLVLTDEPAGRSRSPDTERSHLLEIDSEVRDGRLRVEWKYSSRIHQRETIEEQAARHLALVNALCRESHG